MGHGSCGSRVSWLVGQADHRSQNVTHGQPQPLMCYCNKKCYIIVWSLFEVRIAADYDPQADESVAPLVHSEASEPDVVLIYRAYMTVKLTPLDCKSPSACLDRRHRIPFANPPHLYSNLFYRAMLRRARYCYGKLSVCPSVRNVEVLWLHRLEIFKNNFMVS